MGISDYLRADQENNDNPENGQSKSPHDEDHYGGEYGNRQCGCILPYPKSPYQQPPPNYVRQHCLTTYCPQCGRLLESKRLLEVGGIDEF